MLISVILVNFHSEADIHEAIDSLEQSVTPTGFERKVMVVDNGSTDQSWTALQDLKKYPDLELLQSKKNLGFTGGNNLAIKRARELKSEYFLLLNPDTKVDKNFLVELLKPFQNTAEIRYVTKEREIGIASPKIYFYPGFEFHKDRYQEADRGKVIWYAGGKIDWDNVVGTHLRVDEVDKAETVRAEISEAKLSFGSTTFVPTDYCTGCCMLIHRHVMEKIGGLDDKLFFSMEDLEYCVRARNNGFESVYAGDSFIWHKNANTSGGAGSPTQDFYSSRNRIILAFRYTPWKTRFLVIRQTLSTGGLGRLKAVLSALKALV